MPSTPGTRGIMALAGFTLLAALWAGLARIGWGLPPLGIAWVGDHGPLMIAGVLGTVISLERAVALSALPGARRRVRAWQYIAPLLSGLGALAVMGGLPPSVGRGLIALGSLGLTAIFVVILRLRPDWAHTTMGVGALLWLAGNVLWWLGWPASRAAPLWAGFLVLTIAGERLELARVLLLRRPALVAFAAANTILLAGLALSPLAPDVGVRVAGAGLLAVGSWLFRFDLARKTIGQRGLTRFIAACLLSGYAWLIVAGGLWLYWGAQFQAGPIYDAMLHSLLLGFVFSMIFGHAPIIIPAVAGVAIPYFPRFYVHLALLHASLALRLVGDLASWPTLRMWGGMFNVIALLMFLGSTALAVRQGGGGRS